MTEPVPEPTYILRMIHISNLSVCIQRRGLHAPNMTPLDGLFWRFIHSAEVQSKRKIQVIPCGPGGTVHDYVPFYFGPLSPMLLNLKTGRVSGYNEGQEVLVYLVSTVQAIESAKLRFVFSDGHGIARLTNWKNESSDLGCVDWAIVRERYWKDTVEDMDRQRRKQAEFLVHQFVPWNLISEIAVFDAKRKRQAEQLLSGNPDAAVPPVVVRRDWYYA
ncbi:MAG: DUF4433 domain-containing protein [Candidatus Hydrogenedentes bacterium]|nr:DUF4433 domain-containing protein [Candidatus Hydrogenedentota bacterium]